MTPKEIYDQHVAEAKKAGKSRGEQHAHGLRHLNHAGFFKGPKGWQRVHADLRDKVEVREAYPQPGGTFTIYDCTVFYPNAVKSLKGTPEVYTADDIRQIIKNTNFAIEHEGGQKPGILEGHPNMLQAMNGMQMDVHGFAVNWRESPRGAGWAMCDLIGVDPEYVDRLKKKKLTGMSAYIAEDNEKLNRRFGHVALLGGSTQALSHLPMHDVYAACCFSANPAYFQGEPMKLTPKQEQCFAAMAKAGAGYAAAQAAFSAKEPGADMKVKEATGNCFSAFAAAKGAFDDGGGMGGAGEDPTAQPAQDVPQFDADGKRKDLPVEAGLSLMDQDEPQQMEFSADTFGDEQLQEIVSQFSSEGGSVDKAFHRLAGVVRSLSAARKSDVEKLSRVQKLNRSLVGNIVLQDYKAFCAGLRQQGHQFDAETENQMFSFAMTNQNPKTALANAKAMLMKMPKVPSLAAEGQVFEASAGSAPRLRTGAMTADETDKLRSDLAEMVPNREFSEMDARIGAAFSPDTMINNAANYR